MIYRCEWAKNPLAIQYHDTEWGVPTHDERELFELLVLEGAQAGLSWDTVLKKRDSYRKAFNNFDVKKVAAYNERNQQELLSNPGIIRNKLKVASAVRNAQAFTAIQQSFGSFDAYIWSFTSNTSLNAERETIADIPSSTVLSDKISKDLKKRGFNFVGTTIIYAYLQSIGIVNDHSVSCFRHKEIVDLYS